MGGWDGEGSAGLQGKSHERRYEKTVALYAYTSIDRANSGKMLKI